MAKVDAYGPRLTRALRGTDRLLGRGDRVALTVEQVVDYNLPPMVSRSIYSRANAFRARYGDFVQMELDALPPDVLRSL